MRVLVVGAGAIGGFFGGRLLQSGADVTFLVRPKRATELRERGLVIKSPNGDAHIADPPTVQADGLKTHFDLVLLSCKAFDLDDAMASLAPAVGPGTTILPLLNGMRHLNILDARFGGAHVLGGLCQVAATLNDKREVVQITPMQSLGFGERDGTMSERVNAIAAMFAMGHVGAAASATVMQDMWEKWIFLATLAGATCAMRGPIGVILQAPGGRDFILGLCDEISAVAAAAGHAPRAAFLERAQGMLTTEGSPLTASMFRDIKSHAAVEADHVIGDLLARADAAKISVPRLRMTYTHLKAYEAARAAG